MEILLHMKLHLPSKIYFLNQILFLNQDEKNFWGEYHFEDYENLPIALIDNNVVITNFKTLQKIFYKLLKKTHK